MNVQDKFKDLIARFGNTPEAKAKVEELLQAAETLDKTAEQVGLTAKEESMSKEEMKKKIMAMMDDMDETQMQAMMTKAEKATSKEKEPWFVGDMTPDEFDQRLQQAVIKFLTPAMKEIGEQVTKMNDAQAVTAKESSDKLAATIKSQQDILTDVSARLAALEGLKPRAYRATEDPGNITSKETVEAKKPKGDKQADDSLLSWLSSPM